ncbi:expressed protein [Phakopsora pachyrhizi]|uniref:Expressed protein n=1 Tax=Phakopsora pachyrhizi TaxID=170000 RepID=A0AAV0BQR4_PHAPC|nr:expressed protein [Phakopsora pachyrhizi]
MSDCVSCNTPPEPCNCKSDQTCVQTPRNCTTCPQNICIGGSSLDQTNESPSINLAGTIGGAVGGTAAGIIIITVIYLFIKRSRSNTRNRTNSNKRYPLNIDKHSEHLSLSAFLSFIIPSRSHQNNNNSNSCCNASIKNSRTGNSFKELSKNRSSNTHSTIYLPNSIKHQSPTSARLPPIDSPNSSSSLNHNLNQISKTSSHQLNKDHNLNKRLSAHLMDVLDPELIKFNLSTPTSTEDPFSDPKIISPSTSPHMNVIISQVNDSDLPLASNRLSNQNLIPIAYIPPNSKSLSIGDVEDRDGLGNSSPSPTGTMSSIDHYNHHHQPGNDQRSLLSDIIETIDNHQSTVATVGIRSSFLASPLQTPSSINSSNPSNSCYFNSKKPVRPPRAPDLDLRLPPPVASSLSNSPQTSKSSNNRLSGLHHHESSERQDFASKFSIDSSVLNGTVGNNESSLDRWVRPASMSIPVSPLNSRQNIGSVDGMPSGARLSLDSIVTPSSHSHLLPPVPPPIPTPSSNSNAVELGSSSSVRPISSASDLTRASHLSSILDPAMIVTPVTLVRTASGKQAAVQRVALRGQEKARVVRLANKPNSSSNSSAAVATTSSSLVPGRVTVGSSSSSIASSLDVNRNSSSDLLSPSTPGMGRSDQNPTRLSGLSSAATVGFMKDRSEFNSGNGNEQQLSPSVMTIGSFDYEKSGGKAETGLTVTVENPFADPKACDENNSSDQELTPRTASAYSTTERSRENGEVHESREIRSSESKSELSELLERRKTQRSSFGGSSSFEGSIMEDEEVQFATVLGRSTNLESEVSPQHRHLRSIGRDRTISLSSMIDDEMFKVELSRRGGGVGSGNAEEEEVPPIPAAYRPFAGQKGGSSVNGRLSVPSTTYSADENGRLSINSSIVNNNSNRRSSSNNGGNHISGGNFNEDSNIHRLSSTSSVSDSCGSVLEGIPFNIRLHSEDNDDMFGFEMK